MYSCDLDNFRSMDTTFDGTNSLTKDFDLIIKCKDGVELHVHLLIMSKWSTVFRCMPDTNDHAKSKTSPAHVNVEEDAAVWRELLGLIYPATPVTILDWVGAFGTGLELATNQLCV